MGRPVRLKNGAPAPNAPPASPAAAADSPAPSAARLDKSIISNSPHARRSGFVDGIEARRALVRQRARVYPSRAVTPRQAFFGKPPLNLAARLVAFLAVGLLAVAGVKSTVMQALDAAPAKVATACPMGMPGMDMSDASAKADRSGSAQKSSPATCPFCVAAANVSLQSLAEPIPAPVSVAWTAPPPVSDHSPRGPPLVRPRARGPPNVLRNV
jgi:Protein of unknown function (DUF2946)